MNRPRRTMLHIFSKNTDFTLLKTIFASTLFEPHIVENPLNDQHAPRPQQITKCNGRPHPPSSFPAGDDMPNQACPWYFPVHGLVKVRQKEKQTPGW